MPPALAIRSLCKVYGARAAVSDISFSVRAGELHGLLGANGSGKSTVLNGVTGVIQIGSGSVDIFGTPHGSVLAKRQFAYVADDLPLPDSLSGNEFLDFHDRLAGRKIGRWREVLIDVLDLGPHLGKFVGECSHGTKKKLQLVAAFAALPGLLILDEPFRGLDASAYQTLLLLVRSHRDRGGAVLLATHDLDFADRECSNVTILDRGRVAAAGSPAELRRNAGLDSLASVFLEVTSLDQQITEIRRTIDAAWPDTAALSQEAPCT